MTLVRSPSFLALPEQQQEQVAELVDSLFRFATEQEALKASLLKAEVF